MAFRLALLALVIASVNAGVFHLPRSTHLASENHENEPTESPHYSYKYSVDDPKTGDYKTVEESRDGDNVNGYFTYRQPDGIYRTVTYTVDKNSGFVAKVDPPIEAPADPNASSSDGPNQSHNEYLPPNQSHNEYLPPTPPNNEYLPSKPESESYRYSTNHGQVSFSSPHANYQY